MRNFHTLSRRDFIAASVALAGSGLFPDLLFAQQPRISKAIPASGEQLPVIGMGTSRTFNAAGNPQLMAQLLQVTQAFFDAGGGMIDSSPMYGSAQAVIGELLGRINSPKNLFAATKVWIDGQAQGIEQMEQSRQLWGVERFDLMQIHNLVDWQTHLETLQQMKASGKVRYIGITTSHGRYHRQLEKILEAHPFDFVQLSYNIGNRDVESRLLPIARERDIAVIVNRPFQRGSLFRAVKGDQLPGWTDEFGCGSWAQFFLKYAVSHPAVTCAIPATSKVKHMVDNMQAGNGRLPTAQEREKMVNYYRSL